jgi:uncharacterized protein (TIGR03435 family)
MGDIARGLESNLHRPVVDETGLTNHFDVTLKWDQKSPDQPNPESLLRALQEQMGLDLVPAVRPMEMVRISQIKGSL